MSQTIEEVKKSKDKVDVSLKDTECSFQRDINALWGKETLYRKMLDESEKCAAELLFEKQGHKIISEISYDFFSQCIIDDYERLGRTDVAELFRKRSNPREHSTIFKVALEKYSETHDEAYGLLLALCYRNGYGTEIDKKKAFEIYQALMESGSVLGHCEFAHEYRKGVLLSEDRVKFQEHYTKLIAQQKFYTPHFVFGFYRLSESAEENVKQGLALLHSAATNRQSSAAFILADFFLYKVTDKEMPAHMRKQKAYFYAKLAADLQSPLGIFILATCYAHAVGVPQDCQRYLSLLHKSIELGCSRACMQLACHYTCGIKGLLAIDIKKSLALAFQAIRQEIAELKNYEPIFEQHKNNRKFMEIAYSHCLQCLEGHLLDNPRDSVVMGAFYQKGILVPKNLELAFACFQKAVKQGNFNALEALNLLCMGNKDTPPVLEASLMYRLESLIDDSVILSAVRKSRSQYTPLLEAVKEHWNWINAEGCKETSPDVICRIVVDYAFQEPDVALHETAKSEATKLERKAS